MAGALQQELCRPSEEDMDWVHTFFKLKES
jgi:hypothetical protein